MNKTYIILMLIYCLSFFISCQSSPKIEQVRFQYENPVIVFYNDKIIDIEQYTDSASLIGMVIDEYVNRKNGLQSIIEPYVVYDKSEKSKIPVFFLFTKDRLLKINHEELINTLKTIQCKFIFKIDNNSLSDDIYELENLKIDNINTIFMIKDFKLTNWNTRKEDMFILFVVNTKN